MEEIAHEKIKLKLVEVPAFVTLYDLVLRKSDRSAVGKMGKISASIA